MEDQQTKQDKEKFTRKIFKSQSACCFLVGLSWVLFQIMDFLGGYRGFHLTFFFYPAVAIPALFALTLTLIVLARGIWSIVRLRNIIRSLILIVLTVAFWFIPSLCPQRPYLVGFKYRVLRLSSPQELREIASKTREILTEQDYLPGPGKNLWEEEVHAKLWGKLPKVKILSGSNDFVVLSVSDNNNVDLSWGGALAGHWGIRIAEESVERSEYDAEYIMIEEDIAVYMYLH